MALHQPGDTWGSTWTGSHAQPCAQCLVESQESWFLKLLLWISLCLHIHKQVQSPVSRYCQFLQKLLHQMSLRVSLLPMTGALTRGNSDMAHRERMLLHKSRARSTSDPASALRKQLHLWLPTSRPESDTFPLFKPPHLWSVPFFGRPTQIPRLQI